MVNQYETVFIVTPVLSETQVKETVEKFRGLIAEKGGELIHEENWGLKKMAYPIQKKSTGFYYLLEFKADPAFVSKFEIEMKRDERVIRFMTVKLDKYAALYSERRKKKNQTAKAD